MELRPEQLSSQVASQPLAPVYLVAGPEMLRVLEAADAVRARARAEGISEREVFDADGRDFDWNQLDSSFNAPSLFSARRLVEVRLPSGKPGKEGSEVISSFCARPPSDVVLLITAGEWSKAHQTKWFDAVAKAGVVSIAWAIKPHELSDWIDRRLRGKGLRADPAAVQRLAERVEGNLLAAAQEIDKLALLAEGKALDVATMESLVADAPVMTCSACRSRVLRPARRGDAHARRPACRGRGGSGTDAHRRARTAAYRRTGAGPGPRRQPGRGNEGQGHLGGAAGAVQARAATPSRAASLGALRRRGLARGPHRQGPAGR
jgi:DNA polymerase III, delta subunit